MLQTAYELLGVLFFSGVVVGIAGLGVLSLPWRDEQYADTQRAVRDAVSAADRALQAQPTRRRGPAGLAATVAGLPGRAARRPA